MKLSTAFVVAGICLLSACSRCAGAGDSRQVYFPANGTCEDAGALAKLEAFRDLPFYAALSASAYDYKLTSHGSERTSSGPLAATLEEYCGNDNASYKPGWLDEAPPDVYITPGKPGFGWDVGGLGYQIYAERLDSGDYRVYLVFRGTDANEIGDWFSDFRWVSRVLFFLHDEYDQMQRILPDLVGNIRKHYGRNAAIEVAGHSLGGGLAQFAAYDFPIDEAGGSAPAIKKAYVFDPSPVTGFYSVEQSKRKANATGLQTFRVYDHGEVLAYLRLLMKLMYPVAAKDPQIIEVRYNLLKGNPIKQHGMRELACALWENTGRREREAQPGSRP
jgi:pimeloyl-ACP methyl ester carboxylesterase